MNMKAFTRLTAVVAVTAILILSFSSCGMILQEPEITSGEFQIVVEYEIDGETYIIEDTVVCSYKGIDRTGGFPQRMYYSSLKGESDRTILELKKNTESFLTTGRVNDESYIVLYYGSGGYFLGDPDEADKGPCINYVERYSTAPNASHSEVTQLTYGQLEDFFGIKIIRFEFGEPIENTFSYSFN